MSSATKLLLLGVVIVSLGGCIRYSTKVAPPSVEIAVVEPDRIRFSGKGAGAGMMMAGTMGPMGIAIGVAIDEGIGKDIDRTAREGNVSVTTLIRNAVSTVNVDAAKIDTATVSTIVIMVERYGFITVPGGNDLVQAQLHLSFDVGDERRVIRVPEDFRSDATVEFATFPLDEVKTSAETIRQAFANAAIFAVTRGLGGNGR